MNRYNVKGIENDGCEEGEKKSEEKMGDGLELKEPPKNNNFSIGFENEKRQADNENKPDLDNFGVIVRWTLKVRHLLKNWFFGENTGTKVFWIILINGAAAALLAASVIEYLKNDSPPVDWCHGVGFLWILYFITYIGISYSILKHFLGKTTYSFFNPLLTKGFSLTTNKYFRWFCYGAPILTLAAYVLLSPGKSGRRIFSFLGIVVFIIFGFLFSKYPSQIKWRPVISGLVLQFIFGLITIRVEIGRNVLDCLGNKVTRFLQYTEDGANFVYGYLAKPKPESDTLPVFAFSVLPVIFFLSFVVNILSYYGALQWFIMKISRVVKLAMGTTVCESVNAAASIFLGMTEAPLLIRTYLKDLTKSEICAILCAGWSTVAGVVLAAYIQSGVKASHLIAASIMSAPASLSFSKLFYPETEESKTSVDNIELVKEEATNALDAASKGALAGVTIIGGIVANIIAFLAFIAFLDGTLGWIGDAIGFEELSFQYIMSKIFYPVSFLMGVDEDSLEDVAYLVGIKTVANEFQAYKQLGELIKQSRLSERSEIIATYALCGFSNFGSIGITIGSLSSIEPRQASTITEVAIPAFIAANIVCFLTACVAGCLID